MGNLFLMSDFLNWIILFLLFASPIAFVIGIILIAVSKDTRKFGIKLLIGSVITFIIGFGTCLASMNI